MFMTTHMAAMPASQISSGCLHHLKSLRSCWENPKICQTGLAAATDCSQKHQPSEVHMGCHMHLVNLCQKGQQLPEARDTKEGEVGGLQHHPKEDPGGGMEKAMLWGHSWRFTRKEVPRCTPSGKTHPGAEMPLKGVCKSRAELRKWEKKTSKSSKKNHYFLILTCDTWNLIKGTEHNMKWRQREWRLWRRQERCQNWNWVQERGRKSIFPRRFFGVFFNIYLFLSS